MIVTLRRDTFALIFFVCMFAALSSGRLASYDAGEQLRAAMALATLGSAGVDASVAGPGWIPAPNGRRYEPHDIGNLILMLPAALLGAVVDRRPALALISDPPLASRALASLTNAALAGVGCAWLFRLFAFYTDRRKAFLLALAFPLTTTFAAYARSAWDVAAACSLMCGVLYYSSALLRGLRPGRSVVLLAVTLACACSFRYSLAPFFVPAAAICLLPAARALDPRALVRAAAAFVTLMLPTFAYNFVRTGSLLRPGTAAPMYLQGANALAGSLLHGLYGLLLSPNRGVVFFAPVLLVATALPFVWRAFALDQRRLVLTYGCAAAAYLVLIAKLAAWGTFGWGARYLVPVLPVAFVAAAYAALHARSNAQLAIVLALAVLSAAIAFPTLVVNWSLAVSSPEAADPESLGLYQQGAVWTALIDGLRGTADADPAHPGTPVFPDLLAVRLARESITGALVACVFVVCTLGTAAYSLRRAELHG